MDVTTFGHWNVMVEEATLVNSVSARLKPALVGASQKILPPEYKHEELAYTYFGLSILESAILASAVHACVVSVVDIQTAVGK